MQLFVSRQKLKQKLMFETKCKAGDAVAIYSRAIFRPFFNQVRVLICQYLIALSCKFEQ